MNSKIIVIGAGAAGIAAATKLISFGFQNVTILEAENRIGGRIFTKPFAKSVVDLGAQWCHGETDNAVYAMAREKGFEFGSTTETFTNLNCVLSNGISVDKEKIKRLQRIVDQIMEKSAAELQGSKENFGEYFNEKYKKYLQSSENRDIDTELASQYLALYNKYECGYNSCDTLFELSGDGMMHYKTCDGDNALTWKDKGYITILKVLMEVDSDDDHELGLLNGKIVYNKTVEEIRWNQNACKHSISIKCKDSSNFEADHTICTVSLGVLKAAHQKMFVPALPLNKSLAIDGISIGTVNKVILEFPEIVLPANSDAVFLLWREEDLVEIRKRSDSWIEDIVAFFVPDCQPRVLSGWISGVSARRMEEFSDAEVIDSVMYVLRRFLGNKVPEPINFIRSSWYKNPNFRGSYSFRSVQTDCLNVSAADLAEPLYDQISKKPEILFAGEASHSHFYSTVHGAIETGWREANRIFDFYREATSKL